MTTWLEFHDSILAAVNRTTKDVEVVLDACVQRWDIVGDSWMGTGWMQPVRILISDVGGGSPIEAGLPIDISDGHLRVGAIIHDNLVRLPFNASDAISLWLQLTNADVVEIAGRGVQIDAVGEARFVEDLPADLRPGDAGLFDRHKKGGGGLVKPERGQLGVLMCLPLAFLGAIPGAAVGFLLPLLPGLVGRDNAQAGLISVFVGMPVGALVGGILGFRTARRL